MTVFGSIRSAAIVVVVFAETCLAQAPAPIASPSPPATACTPGHCVHRTGMGRRQCKRHLQEVLLGFPEEFERPPLGAMVYAVNREQVRNGEAAAMVLHQFDFEAGTPRLNVRGQNKLATIAARLPIAFDPVIVEQTGDVALDNARRSAVFDSLAVGPFTIPIERVVVSQPIARGLRGEDAMLIHDGSLTRIRQAGPILPSFDTAGTSFLKR